MSNRVTEVLERKDSTLKKPGTAEKKAAEEKK